jgi:hypothetical protein
LVRWILVIPLIKDLGKLLSVRIGVRALYPADESSCPPAAKTGQSFRHTNIAALIQTLDQIAPGLHERLVIKATRKRQQADIELTGKSRDCVDCRLA